MLPRGTLHITRSRFIWAGVCYEMIRVRNFALEHRGGGTGGAIRFAISRTSSTCARSAASTRRARASSASSATASRRAVSAPTKSCARPWSTATPRPKRFPPTACATGCRSAAAARRPSRSPSAAARRTSRCRSPPSRARWRRPRSSRAATAGRRARCNRATPPFNAWMQRSSADIGMMLTVDAARTHSRGRAAMARCHLRT